MNKKYIPYCFSKTKTFSNCIFVGSPGTGKTSIIRYCGNQIYGKEYVKENMMEIFGLTESYFQDSNAFIEDENIINWINEDVRKYSPELSKFERIKGFILKRNPFTIEEEEMTPTLKIKRRIVEKKYAAQIDEMYLLEEVE